MADTLTKNFKFVKPAFNKKPWQQAFYDSMDSIDAVLARYILVSNFVGVWNQATAYTATQRVVDTVGGAIYTCNVNHTSTAINTFAQDRIANPTFWTIYTFSVQFRGTWATNTDYSTGDFVVFGQKFAVANSTHHSSASFVTDQTNGLWSVLIDGTAVVALPSGTVLNADQTIRYDGVSLQYQLTSNLKVSSAGVTTLPAGAVGAPSLNFNAQGGFYSPGANLVALTVGGVEIWRQKNDGTATLAFPDAFRQGLGFPAAAAANAGSAIGWDSNGTALTNVGATAGTKNRLINGDMRFDQRNVGAALTPTTTAYTLDRWQAALSASSKLTFQQVGLALTPRLPLALKVTVAAQYTPAAGEIFVIRQAIEGVNILDLAYGSANAKTINVSFWVQSSITGLYNIFLGNNAATRAYAATFNIAVANTPQFVTLTIPGDTTGVWAADVTAGLWVGISLGAGSTYTMAVGAWTAAAGYSGTGTVNFVSQVNGSTFYLSGVQAEIGSVATAFEQRLYGFELALCQRYFRKSYPPAIAPGTAGATASEMINYSFSATGWIMYIPLTPTMRTSPTVTTFSPVTGTAVKARNDNLAADVATTNQSSETGVLIAATGTGAQQQITVHFAADAEL